jgi:aminopeptidase N
MGISLTKWPLFVLGLLMVSCGGPAEESNQQGKTEVSDYIKDPHSHADLSSAVVTHMDMDLYFDFSKKTLEGTIDYTINRLKGDKLILDVSNLNIHKIYRGLRDTAQGIHYVISSPDPVLGSSLTIDLPKGADRISIYYTTNPNSAALQWLEPRQTADKKLPFVFTQGQAILTRTWLPCQDSPGARITYDAKVSVQPGMLAVMSAENPTEISDDGTYTFKMDQPIPPYLIALAAGQMSFASVGPSTGVYAENSMLTKSVYEFGEVEDMMTIAEQLYGPYQWDRYDILVLPPSFPFGGMENPRFTFATPTILAGDRSLTALIAHELAHSWSGNLVTNSTWNDFWLNEGFTVYFERRIMEALYGVEYANMLALIGYQDLEFEIEDLGEHSPDTHLKLSLEGRDPDDGMTDIAYEKGAYLLILIENKVGRERFDEFLKSYFAENRFKTMNTEDFVIYLNDNLLTPENVSLNLDEWIYGPGIPDNIILPQSDKFVVADQQVALVAKGNLPDQKIVKEWSSHEWLHFIRHLPQDLSQNSMARLDSRYSFTFSGNSELKAAWYELAINNGYARKILEPIQSFLVEVGRRKFLTPIYRALKANGMIEEAKVIYKSARPNYHSVAQGTIDDILEI